MVIASWELLSCFYSCFIMMVRNAQLTLTKGKKSAQAFMGWVSSIGIDTHIFPLLDTWSDTALTGEFHSFLPSLPDSVQ